MRLLSVCVLACALLASGVARADDAMDEARDYWKGGLAAYKAAKYDAAVQAWERAYELAPRPPLLFSLGQALRRQHFAGDSVEPLRRSVRYFRRYLEAAPEGERRAEAVAALSDLVPRLSRLAPEGDTEGDTEGASKRPETRLLVSSSAEGAKAAIDDRAASEVPVVTPIAPGRHRVSVSAPGYLPEKRTVAAVEGELVAVDVPLRARPAELAITGVSGAEVRVDGQRAATLPSRTALELEDGEHQLSVSANGHRPLEMELSLERGEHRRIEADLPPTGQRIGAYTVMAMGAAGMVGAGVLTGLAFSAQSNARDLSDQLATTGKLTEARRQRHNEAIARRDDLALAAGLTGGAGAAALVTGGLLYALDEPTLEPALESEPDAPREPEPLFELSLRPAGLSVRGRF